MFKHTINQSPHLPSNNAVKKEVMYTLKLFTEGTFHWFWNASPSQIIPSHNFIL
jgi:hypothetical protein